MEILYPLPALSGEEPQDHQITVLVSHLIEAGARPAFLEALKTLLTREGADAGPIGHQVFQEDEGACFRITILQRFASAEAHEAWLRSEEFARWKRTVEPLRPQLEQVRHYSGVEALFAAGQSQDSPPRWKMAIVLFLAVFPLSLALSHWFGRALASTPPLIGALISSPVMVVLMTYVMVPLLTRVFRGWLQPSAKRD